jgi:hypothetical protein
VAKCVHIRMIDLVKRFREGTIACTEAGHTFVMNCGRFVKNDRVCKGRAYLHDEWRKGI